MSNQVTRVMRVENPVTRRIYEVEYQESVETPLDKLRNEFADSRREVPKCMSKSMFDWFLSKKMLRPMREVLSEVRP